MTNTNTKMKELTAIFPAESVKWRIGQSGTRSGNIWAKVLAYIDARTIMQRLDDVLGPENWKTEVEVLGEGVLCKLSLRIGEEWITKVDGAEFTKVEGFKGGISKALVRTASLWGIGRYLYKLKDTWAETSPKKSPGCTNYATTKDKTPFYWGPPTLPDWAKPK